MVISIFHCVYIYYQMQYSVPFYHRLRHARQEF